MATPFTPSGALIEKRILQPSRSLLSKPAVEYPALPPTHQLVEAVSATGGAVEFVDRTGAGGTSVATSNPVEVFIVSRARHAQFQLFIPSVCQDGKGHRYDLFTQPFLRIRDGLALLRLGIGTELSPDRPLTDAAFAEWLTPRVLPVLLDRLAGRDHRDLSDGVATPIGTWADWIQQAVGPFGIDSHVGSLPSWSSHDAELARREEEAARKKTEAEAAARAEEDARGRVAESERARAEAERVRADEERSLRHRAESQAIFQQAELEELQAQMAERHRSARLAEQVQFEKLQGELARCQLERKAVENGLEVTLLEIEARKDQLLVQMARLRREAAVEDLTHLNETARLKAQADRAATKGATELDRLADLEHARKETLAEAEVRKAKDDAAYAAEARRQGLIQLQRDDEVRAAEHTRRLAELSAARHEASKSASAFEALQQQLEALKSDLAATRVYLRALFESLQQGNPPAADVFFDAEASGLHASLMAELPKEMARLRTVAFAERLLARGRQLGRTFTLLRSGTQRSTGRSRNMVAAAGSNGGTNGGSHGGYSRFSVRIGTPNHLEMRMPHDGFVTLINPGTGGDFYLLTPNDDAMLVQEAAGEWLKSPGKLIPGGLQPQFGPPGQEYLVALVTPEPLVTISDLRQADSNDALHRFDPYSRGDIRPFRWIAPSMIDRIERRLGEFQDGTWSVSVLRYLVVP